MLRNEESITRAISDELYVRAHQPYQKAVADMSTTELDSLKAANKRNVRHFKPINIEDARKRGLSIGELVDQYFQDEQMNMGKYISLKLLSHEFEKYNVEHFKYRIVRYNSRKEPMDSIGEASLSSCRISKMYSIGSNKVLYVQFKFHIGMSDFFVNQLWITGLTAVLMLLVVVCLFLQLREIRQRNRLLKVRTQNVDGTIHDMKAPLNSVIALLEWLKKSDIGEARKKAIQLSLTNIRHTVCNIEALLMTSRSDHRKLVLNKEPLDMLSLVEGVKNELDITYAGKPHLIVVENKLPPALLIEADGMYIENVFRNLLENALKYSSDGVRITVSFYEKNGTFHADIRDNGWGIPRKYLKRLFVPFFQVPRDKAHSAKGFGIGLAQVLAIVKAHGGTLHVESIENEGSCFSFTIPVT